MNKNSINQKCDFCGKRAIGIQILGFIQQTVCKEHAEKILVTMEPGERQNWGECYFVRYE